LFPYYLIKYGTSSAEASAQAGKKKSGVGKIKNAKKTFLRGGERRRGGASVSFKEISRKV